MRFLFEARATGGKRGREVLGSHVEEEKRTRQRDDALRGEEGAPGTGEDGWGIDRKHAFLLGGGGGGGERKNRKETVPYPLRFPTTPSRPRHQRSVTADVARAQPGSARR